MKLICLLILILFILLIFLTVLCNCIILYSNTIVSSAKTKNDFDNIAPSALLPNNHNWLFATDIVTKNPTSIDSIVINLIVILNLFFLILIAPLIIEFLNSTLT